MKHLLRSFFFFSAFVLFAVMFTGSALAQPPSPWTSVATPFTGTIHIVKFIDVPGASRDASGAPLVGFVSDGPEIYRTTNGGLTPASWTLATIVSPHGVPIPFPSGWVNDISFLTDRIGAAVITNSTNAVDAGVLITMDGGATWTFDDIAPAPPNVGTPDSGAGIYWNPANHLLFVSSLDKGLLVSSDTGQTWTQINPANYFTGFAFNGARGVVATQGSNENGFAPNNHWLYTTDGGQTWSTSQMFYDCWQPCGIPTTETFFASTNFYTGGATAILRSDNSGYAFGPTPYANTADTLTEAMQGDGCGLFASSAAFMVGMWTSSNEGASWTTIMDAPLPPVDTRFYLSPTKVWSFTGHTLEYTARLGTAPIHVWPDTIAFTGAACGKISDTVIHIFGCACANNDVFTGTSITNSNASTTLTVTAATLPRPLCTSATSPQGNPDSVTIHYQPGDINPDLGTVHLLFNDNGNPVDESIHVYGNGVSPGVTLANVPQGNRFAFRESACGDTCGSFTIENTSCSPVTITKEFLTEQDSDTCVLHITTSGPLPVTLAPGTNFTVTGCFTGKLAPSTTSASVQFEWVAGTTDKTTQNVTFTGITTTGTHPYFRGFDIKALSCCKISNANPTPVPIDTVVFFENSTDCPATMTLYAPTISGKDASIFSIDPDFEKPKLVFPLTLAQYAHIQLPIRINDCRVGSFVDTIHFNYSISTTNCSQPTYGTWDTVIRLSVANPSVDTPSFTPLLNPLALDYFVNCCDTTVVKSVKVTNGCFPDTLVSIAFDSAAGHFASVSFPSVPHNLKGLDPLTLQVRFRQPLGGPYTGSILLTFASGRTLEVQLSGKCTGLAAAPLNSSNMDFGVLACGQGACDTAWIKNSPCGPAKIGVITGPKAPFTLQSPATGTLIAAGDSVGVIVCVNPPPTGTLSDAIVFQITDPNGAVGIPDTLFLTAVLTPPAPSYTVTQLATATICDTDTLDEQFTFTNTGTCYTYVITGANTRNGEVSITPQTARVAEGKTQTFTVHFAPGGVPGNLIDSILLVDSAGNSIEVPYDITVNTCNGQTPVLTLHDTNTDFITSNCTALTRTFAIAASSGTVTVTTVTLTSGTQFTETLSKSLPYTVSTTDTLYVTITYSPDASGPNVATLTVGNLPPLNLTGSVVGTLFTAKFGISTTSPLQDSPNVALNFTISLDSLIPDDLGMTNLTIVVNEPGGLLTMLPTSVTGVGSWQADPSQPPSESAPWTIHLKYTGSTAPGQMIAGGPVATFKAYTAIGKVNTTSVSIGAPDIFNDTNFARCKMSAESDGSSIPFQILLSCSDSIIVKELQGNLETALPSIEIVPNPAHKDGSAATVHFTSNVSAPMTVDVLNVLGNPVAQLMNGPVEKGDHALAIPTNDMAEGAYFVRISVNGSTVVRKFVLEKE